LKITWLGHSTFQFELPSGEVLLMDPWLEGNPLFPADFEVSRLDAMIISHGHFDHIAGALPLYRRFEPVVVANWEICQWLQSKGVAKTSPMNKGGMQKIGPVSVTMTHAMHSSGIDDGGATVYGGEPAGYVLEFHDGRALYFAGDTDVFGDMRLIAEIYKPELVLLPIGDLFTMSPRQAAIACRLLKPRKVIPMHYGTFPPLIGRPEQLAELIGEVAGTEVWTLTPGAAVTW